MHSRLALCRFTATVQELEVYLRILESSGVVKESEKGWYIVSSEARSVKLCEQTPQHAA